MRAAMACIRGGMAGPEMDVSGLVALASANGVPAEATTMWLTSFLAGMHTGRDELKEGTHEDRGDG